MNSGVITSVLFVLVLASCSTAPKPAPPGALLPGEQACTNPRPEVCTMEYRPVCGTDLNGKKMEFSNECSACLNVDVVSWEEGLCVNEQAGSDAG